MNTPNFTLAKAAETNLALVQRISRQTFEAAFAHQNTPENMQHYLAHNLSTEKLQQELQNPNSEFYLAYHNTELAGYLKLNTGSAQTDLQDQHALEIERIYVLPAYFGKQLGQQMLDFAMQQARAKQVQFVWLGVWEHNRRAIRFYQKNGFAEFGKHHFWLGSERQTDLLLRRAL